MTYRCRSLTYAANGFRPSETTRCSVAIPYTRIGENTTKCGILKSSSFRPARCGGGGKFLIPTLIVPDRPRRILRAAAFLQFFFVGSIEHGQTEARRIEVAQILSGTSGHPRYLLGFPRIRALDYLRDDLGRLAWQVSALGRSNFADRGVVQNTANRRHSYRRMVRFLRTPSHAVLNCDHRLLEAVMNRGRKRLPTATKRLHGTLRSDRERVVDQPGNGGCIARDTTTDVPEASELP
jgi:hypothetical protein